MQNDEQEIRQLVSAWLEASKAGDAETLLSLITDDAVFITDQQIMRKDDFAAAARAQAGSDAPKFDGSSEIQEIQILGEWAFLWQKLVVNITLPSESTATTRKGHTLTILKKQDNKWRLVRDANMLAPVDN
jgi:uncharacterized protein (TIGR02246 family)